MPISRPRRSAPRRLAAAVATAGALALALSGCVGAPAPTATTSASSSAEPIFASDEEALAAAEAAYERYSRVLNEVAADGNQNPERVRIAVTEGYSSEVEGLFQDLSQRGLRIEGMSTVDSLKLVERFEGDGDAHVVVLLCSDVSQTRILNSEGADVTPSTRPDRSAIQATLVSSPDDPRTLLTDEEDPWTGDYC